jgi:tetratricopeptide (TPR) repeat protein
MSAFVGRTRELGDLHRRFERAAAGEGGVVFIAGEAGAGKSSLIERFLVETALSDPEARIISGGCSEQFGAGEPYQPFVDAFRGLIAESEDRPAAKRGLRELASELAPYWLQAIPVAGGLIAATAATARELKAVEGGVATAAPPSEEALFFQYTELLFAVAAEHPVVLFVDDLHWADPASVSLLGHIGRKAKAERVLILGTYRAADVELDAHPIRKARLELERYGAAATIELSALDGEALAELVAEELDAPPSPELVRWLEERAGANPLFFTELLRWLVERGHARRQHDVWTLAGVPEELEIPRSAGSAIESRLDRLDPELHRILEYASVQGTQFDSVTLSRLLEVDELELEDQLEPLARLHRLIRLEDTRELPDGELASVYGFGHSLVREVLHGKLVGKRRILLHRKVGQLLEETFQGNTDAIAQRLAIHFDEGRVPDRAFAYAIEAADRAIRVYAHWSALESLARALKNAQNDEQKLDALERMGEGNGALGRYPEAFASLTDALELAESAGDAVRALRIRWRFIALEQEHGGRSPESLTTELAVLEHEARRLGARPELCEVLWHARLLPGIAAVTLVDKAHEALDIAEQVGENALVARSHYEMGLALQFAGNYAEANACFERAREIYAELGDKEPIARCDNARAGASMRVGDFAAAVRQFSDALAMYQAVGNPVRTAVTRNNLGGLLTRMGEWEEAESHLLAALRISERLQAGRWALYPVHNLAELYQAKGDAVAARARWADLLDRSQSGGHWDFEIAARCGLGLGWLEADDLEAARAELDRARALLGRVDGSWSPEHDAVHTLAARLSAREGDHETALRYIEEAETALTGHDEYDRALYRLARAEVTGSSDPAGAARAARDALETFERLGAEAMRRRAAALLAIAGGEA